MRELIMLGTGNAMVTKYYNTCFLLRQEQGDFLVDAGGGNQILAIFEQQGLKWQNVHDMFITHAHTDHILGAVWVIRKVAALCAKKKYEGVFRVYGHEEAIKALETMVRLTLKKKDLDEIGKKIVFVIVQDGQTLEMLNAKWTFFDIMSTKKKQFVFSVIFQDGFKLSCLGDEPYNEHEEKFVMDSDLLLAEAFCLYRDRNEFSPYEKHHSTVKEACLLAEKLSAKSLLLYHTEDKTYPQRKTLYLKEAQEYYHGGKIYVPDDLEHIAF